MKNKGMNRRQFLQTSSRATAGAVALASGAVLVAPDGAWALELEALGPHTGETLLAMARQCYPHDSLADQYYAAVVLVCQTIVLFRSVESCSMLKV